MADEWVTQLQRLNGRLRSEFSDERLGDREQRRRLLQQQVGQIRPLKRLAGADLEGVLQGRLLVGVDGTTNSFGGQFPYYVDFLRALAKPSRGEAITLKDIHCPLPPEAESETDIALRNDNEMRQRKLANLEVQAALRAIEEYRPAVILMDGPLVRFDMRTKESFSILREKTIHEKILLAGCIENIESRVLATVMGDRMPPGWRNRYDRDLLWGVLEYGEVLEVARPAKGSPRRSDADPAKSAPIRTWFMQSSREPGVVGLDLLDEQVGEATKRLADYLFTLSPADGRGIPIWLDLVDREVRLTHVELEAYVELLDPQVRRVFASKRDARFF